LIKQEFQLESNEKMEEPNVEASQNVPDETYYSGLVEKANELKVSSDWQYGAMEFENIRSKWDEGPDIDADKKSELYKEIISAQDEFFASRKQYYEKQNDRKKANLERRQELLNRMKSIIDSKKWGAFGEANSIERKFLDIRPLPPEAESQTEEFNRLMQIFNNEKVEYLVKSRQKEEENLMVKLAILDKINAAVAEISADTKDWSSIENNIEDLSSQWKKVGRVDKDKSDELWEKYKTARDNYTTSKLQFNKEFRSELQKNLKVKTQLVEKAEALLEEPDLAIASKEMNILNKRWKETGPVASDASEQIWERFKTAYDKFSEIRNSNIDKIREIENENLALKETLCEKAESIIGAANEDQREVIEKLFSEWNAIGPIPKRKTKKVWARFKKAVDNIQEQRRNFYKQQRLDQKENLQKKRDIVNKIQSLATSENLDEALNEVKELQQEYQKIGFVPIKQKNKIWDEYRLACDTFYNASRSKSTPSESRPPKSSSVPSVSNDVRSQLKQKQSDLFRLRKECEKLNETILQYADTKTYIKPNKKGQVLIDEIQNKIDTAKVELNQKSDELEKLRKEIEDLS
jgi:hypothetical protein